MGRIRTVKPELFKHGGLFDAEQETNLPIRLAFIALFTCCDREGRFKWRPRDLKVDCLPHDDVDFSRVLDALTTRGFVVRYASEDRSEYGYIPTFNKHQVINNREAPSELPSPTGTGVVTREARVDHASVTREARGQSGREGKGKEGNGNGKEGERASRRASMSIEEFREACRLVVEADPARLPEPERKPFFDYWTETNPTTGRMRFEAEKFFDIGRRMDTWRSRSKNNAPKVPMYAMPRTGSFDPGLERKDLKTTW